MTKRIYEHNSNLVDGFSKKYHIHNLVYYECLSDARSAIAREKQLKEWKRQWKLKLIEKNNHNWIDLFDKL